MAQEFNDIDALFNALLDDIKNSVSEEVSKEMIKIEQEHIDSQVYNAYTPKEYSRRLDNGGLRSEGNMQSTINRTNDGIEVTVHNSTTGNLLYGNYWEGEIQNFIEEGIYMWNCDCPPRPFIDDTQEEIDNSNRIEEAVERALNKLGW